MRSRNLPELRAGGGRVVAVPAVHQALAFAERINDLCRNPATRPDAIAVELPPSAAREIVAWLGDLGTGPERRSRLRCMLGLTRPNRALRPSLKARARDLQLETGEELARLPPELLWRELHYLPSTLVLLSPTDSMIEAIRCGLECGLPVVGVDMEEHPQVEPPPEVVPEPPASVAGIHEFLDLRLNSRETPDPEVNRRRDQVMAARLKGAVERWPRVLYTGGAAHWGGLSRWFHDPAIPAADPRPPEDPSRPRWQRVVVPAEIAWNAFDRLPLVARLYERRRPHPLLDAGRRYQPLAVDRIVSRALRRAIRRLLAGAPDGATGHHAPPGATAAEALARLPGLLANFCRLGLRAVPDAASIWTCARSCLEEELAARLMADLLRYPWLTAGDLPEVAWFEPGPGRDPAPWSSFPGSPQAPEYTGDGDPGAEDFDLPFFMLVAGMTWEPWENLITALSDGAVRSARGPGDRHHAEPVRRCPGGRLAVRETLRALVQGRDDVYVRPSRAQPARERWQPVRGWPVVWIFDSGPAGDSSWHNSYLDLSWITRHVSEPQAFLELCDGPADSIAAIVGFGTEGVIVDEAEDGFPVFAHELRGILLYAPPFNDDAPYARWMELTRCRGLPLYQGPVLGDLPEPLTRACRELTGLPPDRLRWQDAMIVMAAPWCSSHLTLVAPRGFRVGAPARRALARRGRELRQARLEDFSPGDIARIRSMTMMPAFTPEGAHRPIYEPAAVARFGEDRSRFRDRLPLHWRRFALGSPRLDRGSRHG